MQEAEWELDADAYLHKQQLWTHSSLHHEYLLLQMFQHATATARVLISVPSTGAKDSHHLSEIY